jgi:hypothetical protein
MQNYGPFVFVNPNSVFTQSVENLVSPRLSSPRHPHNPIVSPRTGTASSFLLLSPYLLTAAFSSAGMYSKQTSSNNHSAALQPLAMAPSIRQSPLLLPRDADPTSPQAKPLSAPPRPHAAPLQSKASPRNSICSWSHDRASSASPRQPTPSRPPDPPRPLNSWGAAYAPRHVPALGPYHRPGDSAHPHSRLHRSSPHRSAQLPLDAGALHAPPPDAAGGGAGGHGAAAKSPPGGPVGIGVTLVRDPAVRTSLLPTPASLSHPWRQTRPHRLRASRCDHGADAGT